MPHRSMYDSVESTPIRDPKAPAVECEMRLGLHAVHCLEIFMQTSYQHELRAPLGIAEFLTPLSQYAYRFCSSINR